MAEKIGRIRMRILNRYISKTVISSTLIVLLMLSGLEMLLLFLSELDNIGTHNYGVVRAMVYVAACLPSVVCPLFPVIVLMGCLIGLGKLAAQSELIVMQASGISKAQIIGSTMRGVMVMLIFVMIIGEGFSPGMQQFAEHYKVRAQTDNEQSTDRQGLWIHNGNNFIYIDQILDNGHLRSISRYQLDQTTLLLASHAEEGVYEKGHWIFKQVKENIFSPEQIKTKTIDKQIWPIYLDPNFVSVANIDPHQASLSQLHRYIHYLHEIGLYAKPYEFAFWQRILQPLFSLLMIGLAIPFVFGSLRVKPIGFRILIGLMIGFGFYMLNEFVGPFSLLYQIPPFLAAVFPLCLFALLNMLLLKIVR